MIAWQKPKDHKSVRSLANPTGHNHFFATRVVARSTVTKSIPPSDGDKYSTEKTFICTHFVFLLQAKNIIGSIKQDVDIFQYLKLYDKHP